jgi:hypothetical protein
VNVNLVKCMECAERDIQRQTVRHVIQCPGTHIMPKKLRARLRNVNYDHRNSIKRSISKISQNTPASRAQIYHRSWERLSCRQGCTIVCTYHIERRLEILNNDSLIQFQLHTIWVSHEHEYRVLFRNAMTRLISPFDPRNNEQSSFSAGFRTEY